jgi:hypothetical protein
MEKTFDYCETKERVMLKRYIVPSLQKRLNLKYEFSDKNSFDRKDMLAEFEVNGEQIKCVFEAKCRQDIQAFYVEKGLMLELKKYRAIRKLYPDRIFYYVMFLENDFYLFNINKLIENYDNEVDMINKLFKYLSCPEVSCTNKKVYVMKPCILLPTNQEYNFVKRGVI